jgi:cytochrome c553
VIKKPAYFNTAVQALLAIISIAFFATAANAAGSADSGAEKASTCVACHGPDGNSANPSWPSLAGQNEAYFVKTIEAFKLPQGEDGGRYDVIMSGQSMALSEQDAADLGAYFAKQKMAGKVADPALIGTGERLYRGGNKTAGVSACIACHGPSGRGNAPAAYPSLAGQHAVYTIKQLKDYRSAARMSDDSAIMRSISERLTDDEIAAVASYIQGLR